MKFGLFMYLLVELYNLWLFIDKHEVFNFMLNIFFKKRGIE